MTTRELCQNIMHYGPFDRMPVFHWAGWDETHARWQTEGLPADTDHHKFFNASPMWAGVGAHVDLFPPFDEEVLEDTPEYRIFRDGWGVVQQDWKHQSCIPHFIDFTFRSGQDWPAFKERLQPNAARIPPDVDAQIAAAESAGLPVVIGTASMMGWFRNWMGVVNLSYLGCEEPDVLADMVDTIASLVCWQFDEIIPRMSAPPDMGFGWEDICGKNGPLVSPDIFRACVAHGYKKIRASLESHGVSLYGIDTDGYIQPLLRDWFEAGVNVMFPVEIGTWNADPMAIRREFGRDLRIIGGIDKLQLEKGPDAIDAEIERRIPLMRDGGFVPLPDHLITPGTSLENYVYYLERLRDLRF